MPLSKKANFLTLLQVLKKTRMEAVMREVMKAVMREEMKAVMKLLYVMVSIRGCKRRMNQVKSRCF